MINPKNSLILAHTKLKSRKIRAIVTVVISSLLFSLLMLAVILFEGVYNSSFNKFSKDSINSRNMIKARPMMSYFGSRKVTDEDKKILDQMLDQEIASRKKRSKELGLDFDEKSERKVLAPYEKSDDMGTDDWFLASNVIAQRFSVDKNKDNFSKFEATAKQLAEETGSKIFAKSLFLSLKDGNELISQKDGKYQFEKSRNEKDLGGSYDLQESGPDFGSFTLMEKDIYKHFLLSDYKWQPQSGKIPIMLSVNKIEFLLGMKKLDKKASLNDRIARLEEVKTKAANLEIKTCAINSLTRQQQEEAIAYAKKTKEEQKNIELAYGVMDGAICATPVVVKDTRGVETKKAANNQAQFDHEFNNTPISAMANEVIFQVVGVLPADMYYENREFVDSVVQMIIGYDRLDNVVPMDMFMQMSNFANLTQNVYGGYKFEPGTNRIMSENDFVIPPEFFFEYDKPEQARKVSEEYNCEIGAMHAFAEEGLDPLSSAEGCSGTKGFWLSSFGSRASELLLVREYLINAILVVGCVFAVIASIIMAGTVGRLISDSRRETAVFRAIGFKRIDISAVYVNYMMMICGLTIMVAFGIAMTLAIAINSLMSDGMTAQMIWLYSPQDTSLKFNMIGMNWQALGLIAAGIVAVGLVSLILPLLRNIRRNPIRDMRDDG